MVQMANAAAEGVKEAGGAVVIKRVPESESILAAQGAVEAQKSFAHIPVATVEELPEYDAFILGVPTRFGNMVGQMRSFWDHRRTLGKRSTDWKGGKCDLEHSHPTWRAGIHHSQHTYHSASSWDGDCRSSLLLSGANDHR